MARWFCNSKKILLCISFFESQQVLPGFEKLELRLISKVSGIWILSGNNFLLRASQKDFASCQELLILILILILIFEILLARWFCNSKKILLRISFFESQQVLPGFEKLELRLISKVSGIWILSGNNFLLRASQKDFASYQKLLVLIFKVLEKSRILDFSNPFCLRRCLQV